MNSVCRIEQVLGESHACQPGQCVFWGSAACAPEEADPAEEADDVLVEMRRTVQLLRG